MKNPVKPHIIPYVIACTGFLGMVLQFIFFATGVDEKGLLMTGHFADTGSWLLTALVMLFLFIAVGNLKGLPKYNRLFPASVAGAIGSWFGALGMLLNALTLFSPGNTMYLVMCILGVISAICLVILGVCRMRGTQPPIYLHLPTIMFFVLFLIRQYRATSSITQLQEFAFSVFACVFLMLGYYQRAAMQVRVGGRKSFVFFSQGAAFFCFLAVPSNPLFFLLMALWMLLDTCSMHMMTKRKAPPATDIKNEGM